jgi:hypothetical protein
MTHFRCLLAFPFFIFPFLGSGQWENYFWLQRKLFSRQLIRTAPCCGWGGKFLIDNQEVV